MLISDFVDDQLAEAIGRGLAGALGTGAVAATLAMAGAKTTNANVPPVAKPVASVSKPAPQVAPTPTVNPEDELRRADEKLLALTMWGEARSHGVEGMEAVGHVIKNRVDSGKDRLFGDGLKGVVWKNKQFSCWNKNDPNREQMKDIPSLPKTTQDYKMWKEAETLASQILSGNSSDPTNGGLFYHTSQVHPSWTKDMKKVAKFGNHLFYVLKKA